MVHRPENARLDDCTQLKKRLPAEHCVALWRWTSQHVLLDKDKWGTATKGLLGNSEYVVASMAGFNHIMECALGQQEAQEVSGCSWKAAMRFLDLRMVLADAIVTLHQKCQCVVESFHLRCNNLVDKTRMLRPNSIGPLIARRFRVTLIRSKGQIPTPPTASCLWVRGLRLQDRHPVTPCSKKFSMRPRVHLGEGSLTNSSTPSKLVSLVDSDYISVHGISAVWILSTFWHMWASASIIAAPVQAWIIGRSSTKTLLTAINPLELRLLRFSHPGRSMMDDTIQEGAPYREVSDSY